MGPQVFPHILHFKDKKELLFFGCRHTFDPSDKQYEQIKEEFDKFKPKIVLWEGKIDLDLSSEVASKRTLVYKKLANPYQFLSIGLKKAAKTPTPKSFMETLATNKASEQRKAETADPIALLMQG